MKKVTFGAVAALALTACATVPPPPPPPPMEASDFRAEDFAWSTRPGTSSVRGRVTYRGAAGPYGCASNAVVLTPDTPYSRDRLMRLYGALDAAAVNVDVVRSRQAGKAGDAYAKFARTGRCDAQDGFVFDNLPAGSWFVIVATRPKSGQGPVMALLRRVQTARGRPTVVALS